MYSNLEFLDRFLFELSCKNTHTHTQTCNYNYCVHTHTHTHTDTERQADTQTLRYADVYEYSIVAVDKPQL